MSEMFNDEPEDDLTTKVSLMSAHVRAKSTVIATLTTEPGVFRVKGQQATLTVEYNVPPPVTIRPPGILWTSIARLIMSPTNFQNEWLPQIADMHYIVDECKKRNDRLGVWKAVIHAHIYTLPKILWGIPVTVLVALLVHYVTK